MDFPVNHDLHIHTHLSLCSQVKEQTMENILKNAEEHNYSTICFTDHFWDEAVPGAPNDFYEIQNYPFITQELPLPKSDSVRVLFGCETEYCGGDKVGVSKEKWDKFDFIIIPPNHYHMDVPVTGRKLNTPEEAGLFFSERMLELTKADLPWKKIGIAHMTDPLIYPQGGEEGREKAYESVDFDILREAFTFFAKAGAGIELNDDSFRTEWTLTYKGLAIYRLARDCGCKFYRGSDAHGPGSLNTCKWMTEATKLLELTEKELYIVP